MDNGSQDGTAKKISELSNCFAFIDAISLEENMGLGGAIKKFFPNSL